MKRVAIGCLFAAGHGSILLNVTFAIKVVDSRRKRRQSALRRAAAAPIKTFNAIAPRPRLRQHDHVVPSTISRIGNDHIRARPTFWTSFPDKSAPIERPQHQHCFAPFWELVLEPSTRTRLSFESAVAARRRHHHQRRPSHQLGAKGESLADLVRHCELCRHHGIRHPRDDAARLAAGTRLSGDQRGDGSHEHPTQTLCDIFPSKKNKALKDRKSRYQRSQRKQDNSPCLCAGALQPIGSMPAPDGLPEHVCGD
jgi:hypothetical protein